MKYISSKLIESDIILSLVRDTRRDFPRMGAVKMLHYIRPKMEKMSIDIGRDAFIALLSDNSMLVRRKRSKCRTTFSQHRFYKYPNLIRDITPVRPNQIWVSDITYMPVGDGFIYLSLITDAYSRKIVGWNLARDLATGNALKALRMALSTLPAGSELIHHSDRGIQYCSLAYVRALDAFNIRISMTESGDPLENAIAERVNGILKTEWLDGQHFASWSDAVSYVNRIIGLYNEERPHQSLDYKTPALVHDTAVPVERRWKNYYPQRLPKSEIMPDGAFDVPCQAISEQGLKTTETVKPG